ncbi:hypothetical protein HYU09_00725 [Candidatus Woesearchaeota archaeon]|nr:hypothetical protein [Candidatus Woesearchaeota archaeon]
MQKRGQGGEAIRYLLIAAVIIFVTFFGYSIVQKAGDKACLAEIAQFEIGLKNLDKTVKYGSVKEFTEQVPCSADEIYFFDLSKDINLDFLKHLPLLKDSVESKAQKNIFLVKDNRIMGSLYAGNLDIGFPDYICFLPKFGKINFFVEGKGAEAAVFPGCLQPECTYIPESASDEEAASIIREGKAFGDDFFCENCPREVQDEWAKFAQARENVDIFRKYEYCRETGKTNVEITIRPKGSAELRNFRYYESIPKECIDDLQIYLSKVEGEVSIKNDPLMVWLLSDIKTEEKISYELDKLLTDGCKEMITGLGVADAIENGRMVAVPEVPAIVREAEEQNAAPKIEIPDSTIGFRDQEQAVVADLWQYSGDRETRSQELGYSITRQTNTNAIECSIRENKEIWCITKQNTGTISDITLEVYDGQLTASDTFRVIIEPAIVCGNGIMQGIESCDDGNTKSGDGCGSSCSIETGWACTNEPSVCVRIQSAVACGDGICNTVAGESCSTCGTDCGACPIVSEFATLTCRQSDEDCDWPFTEPCDGYENKEKIGRCPLIFNFYDKYLCYNEWNSNGCQENPKCPAGYQAYSSVNCCTPKASTICFENDAYWQDSCAKVEDKKEECGTTTTTSDLRCNGNILERKKINRGCSAGQCTQSQEWITEQNCGAVGKICDANSKSCVSPPPPPEPVQPEEIRGGGGGGGNGGSRCLLEGSEVILSNETKLEVENVEVGDSIKSLDLVSGKVITTKVVKVVKHHPRDFYYSINDELFITNDHPILVKINKQLIWKKAEDLFIGEKIKSANSEIRVESIKRIDKPAFTVYIETESGNFIVIARKETYVVKSNY